MVEHDFLFFQMNKCGGENYVENSNSPNLTCVFFNSYTNQTRKKVSFIRYLHYLLITQKVKLPLADQFNFSLMAIVSFKLHFSSLQFAHKTKIVELVKHKTSNFSIPRKFVLDFWLYSVKVKM